MPKLLLAEDNEDNRDALSRRLQRRGFTVIFAGTGLEAIARAEAEKPDLILMDMNMPELDGWEATRRLKESAVTRDVPVITLTAHAMSGDREKALGAGCSDYHTKPVDLPRLLSQIEAILKTKVP